MTSHPMFLTFNAGSSTIKIGIYQLISGIASRQAFAKIDLHQTPIVLEIKKDHSSSRVLLKAPLTEDLHGVIEEVLGYFDSHLVFNHLIAVGHRVAHGGDVFSGPIILGRPEIQALERLIPLAPLHQAQALFIASAISGLRPNLTQTASFDTAFHRTQSDLVRHYAIPQSLFDEGIKRYGFHGLSYHYISSHLKEAFPAISHKKVIVAHLGSGASLCAIHHGKSQDCSMGFSTLSGIPMSTRCGDLDPGVLLFLVQQRGWSAEKIQRLLYKESGLLGVSGISGDTKELIVCNQASAKLAIDLFALRIAGEIARMASSLKGLDTLVFTGGIGEHQPEIRSKICENLSWMGVELDESLNHSTMGQEEVISLPTSAIDLLVIPTDEEAVIANDLISTLQTRGLTS